MKLHTVSCLAVLLLGACGTLRAERINESKTYSYHSSTGSKTQTAEEIEDIGELTEKQGFSAFREKLRFNVTARESYTTNALLEGSHSSSDAVFLPTIEAGFHTLLGKNFSFDLAFKVESAVFAKYDERNFAGYSAVATLDYRFKPGAPKLFVGVEPYRYDSFDTGDLLTQAIGLTAGADWEVPFNAGRSLAFVGYRFTDYLADPNIDSRLVHRAVVGMGHQIRSNVTGQFYYLYQHSDYTDFDRADNKHTVAANLIYQFSRHWFGSLTTSYVNSDSSQNGASYEGFNAGLGVTVQF